MRQQERGPQERNQSVTALWQASLWRLTLVIFAALSAACSCAWGSAIVLPDVESGRSVEKVEWVKPDQTVRIILKDGIANNWFLFAMRGVKGKTIAIDVVGQETIQGNFPWSRVKPYMADTCDLSSPLLYDEPAYQQHYGHLPWQTISGARFDSKTHTLSLQAHFTTDEATLALTYPCPISYVENRLLQLGKIHPAGQLGIFSAGLSDEGRPLRVVTLPNRTAANVARWQSLPTLLLYGGEHATEHESSQVVMGALEWLLSGDPQAQRFTASYNVILIPHLFPDETVESIFGDITDGFAPNGYETGPENAEWAKFWNRYVDTGNRIDVAFSFHSGVGSSPSIFCPATQVFDDADLPLVGPLNSIVMAQYKNAGFDVDTRLGVGGNWNMRLAGWLDTSFGTTANFYEVNTRPRTTRLSLTELRSIGVNTVKGVGIFFADPALLAQQRLREDKRLAERKVRKAAALADKANPINESNPPDWWTFNSLL